MYELVDHNFFATSYPVFCYWERKKLTTIPAGNHTSVPSPKCRLVHLYIIGVDKYEKRVPIRHNII